MGKNRRNEFTKVRNKILRDNNIEMLICARCGYMHKSNHLHHLKPIVKGGDDDPFNLIPLCEVCHQEWDYYESLNYSFGKFLVTPNCNTVGTALKAGIGRVPSHVGILFQGIYAMQFTGNAIKLSNALDYYEEFTRQNEIFCRYPYSESSTMLALYGDIYDEISMNDFVSFSDGLKKTHQGAIAI